jgi:PTH1 family peptidyl-tRNA hydrolase
VKLIVGLGNPGRSYARHRHNIGFRVVDELGSRHSIGVKKRKFDAIIGEGVIGQAKVICAKPQLYMNRSGYSVGPLFGYFRCEPQDLIVIHDDIDLEVGRLKLAHGSGHGGHNGVRSIIEELGFTEFLRVRIGVGRPPVEIDPADYVLQPFAKDEGEMVKDVVGRAVDAVEDLLSLPFEEVQNKYH